tara:strand:- start:166 stop:960 length:795 start_codon:yes stop_codon:yes gene_type:complete
MRISSNENIKMIMDILNEVLTSKGLSELNSGVKQFVVNRCEHYHKNRLKYKNTKEANKSIIRESYNYIQKMTVQKKNPNNLSNMHKKSSDFDMRLQEHQNNFNTLINGSQPDEIDFSDKIEEEVEAIPVSNMEYIMNQTLADREKELISITTKYNSNDNVEKWLTNDGNNQNVKLVIKDDVNMKDVKNISSKKQVRFKDEESNYPSQINDKQDILDEIKDFIKNQKSDMLKQDILERLDTIIKNQDEILKHLGLKKQNPTMSLH